MIKSHNMRRIVFLKVPFMSLTVLRFQLDLRFKIIDKQDTCYYLQQIKSSRRAKAKYLKSYFGKSFTVYGSHTTEKKEPCKMSRDPISLLVSIILFFAALKCPGSNSLETHPCQVVMAQRLLRRWPRRSGGDGTQ